MPQLPGRIGPDGRVWLPGRELPYVGGSSARNIWYVDNAVGTSGNGQSWATAWKLFTNIVWASVQPGDTIYISGGSTSKTYTGSLVIGKAGTPGDLITITKSIDSGHDGTVIFDGAATTARGVDNSGTPRNYVKVAGFTITGYTGMCVYFNGTTGCVVEDITATMAAVSNPNTARDFDFSNNADLTARRLTGRTPSSATGQTDCLWLSGGTGTTLLENLDMQVDNTDSTGHSDAIQLESQGNTTIRNSRFVSSLPDVTGDNKPVWIHAIATGATVKFYNNLVRARGGQSAVTYWRADAGQGNGTFLAYNNTVYGGGRSLNFERVANVQAKNNILVPDSGGFAYVESLTAISTANITHNIVQGSGTLASTVANGGRTYAQWTTTDGYNASGANANPLLVSPGTDFRIQPGSPAENAGTTLADVTTDYLSVPRPINSIYDIGAYEGTISVNYTAEVTANAPAAWWHLDEATGTTADDAIGSADGTYTGSPTLRASRLTPNDDLGSAVLFDNATTAQYVQVANTAALNPTSITIEALIGARQVPIRLGVQRNSDTGGPSAVADYSAWLGREAVHPQIFAWGGNTTDPWDSLMGGNFQILPGGQWSVWKAADPATRRLAYTVGMLPDASTGAWTLAAGAAGDYDAYWTLLGQRLVAASLPDTILRIGHEFNGSWYPWAAAPKTASPNRAANFITYWRRIVTALRAVPGQAFEFDWCPTVGDSADFDEINSRGFRADDAYPGDAYVDYIGIDTYDQSFATYPASGAVTTLQRDNVWTNEILGGTRGLTFWATYAGTHSKRLSVPEWGVAVNTNHFGGDNTSFIQRMYDWMRDAHVAYASYYDVHTPADFQLSPGSASDLPSQTATALPNASALFRTLFTTATLTWPSNHRIVQKGASDNQYRLLHEFGALKFEAAGHALAAASPPTGARHHLAGTYDAATGVGILYVDGVEVGRQNGTSGNLGTTTDALFIAQKSATAPASDGFTGVLDEVAIYATALAPAAIVAHAEAAGFAGVTFPLTLSGSVTPAGVVFRQISKQPGGTSTPAGVVRKTLVRNLVGASTPAGVLKRTVARVLTAASTPAGTLTVAKIKVVNVTGASTPAATLARTLARSLAGASTPAGTLARTLARSLAGASTPAATLARTIIRPMTASTTPSATLARTLARTLAGASTPTGTLRKTLARTLAAASSPSATLATIKVKIITAAGSVSPSATLARTIVLVRAASAQPSGALAKLIAKRPAGSTPSSATLAVSKVKVVTTTGSASPSAVLRRTLARVLSAAASPSATLARTTSKRPAGATTAAGVLSTSKLATRTVAGTTTPAATLRRTVVHTVTAGVAASGTLAKTIAARLAGLTQPAGQATVSLLPRGQYWPLVRLAGRRWAARVSIRRYTTTLRLRGWWAWLRNRS